MSYRAWDVQDLCHFSFSAEGQPDTIVAEIENLVRTYIEKVSIIDFRYSRFWPVNFFSLSFPLVQKGC
jgi:hypothetical protein